MIPYLDYFSNIIQACYMLYIELKISANLSLYRKLSVANVSYKCCYAYKLNIKKSVIGGTFKDRC